MLTGIAATAQQPMSLNDCMQYAVDNSLTMKIVQEQNNQTQTSRRDAIFDAFVPSVNGYVSAGFVSGKNPDPATNMYTDVKMFQDNYQISGTMPLFKGFQSINNLKISKNAVASGQSMEQLKKDNLCLTTMQAYYNVAYYQRLATIIAAQVSDAEKMLEKSQKELQLGSKSRYDVLESESLVSELQYKLAETEAQHNAAIILLKQTINFPMDKDLTIDTARIADYADREMIDAQSVANYAKNNLPEIVISRYEMEKSKLQLKTARFQCLPQINLSAGWYSMHSMVVGKFDEAQPFRDQIRYNAQKSIGVNINIPIFNGLGYFSNTSRQKSAYKIASYEFQEKQREMEAAAYKAVDEVAAAEKAAFHAQKSSELQKEYREITLKKYQQGLVPYIEYNTVNNKYLQSTAEYLNAVYLLHIKRAIADYYNGKSYINN
jgi:outer membrane protein